MKINILWLILLLLVVGCKEALVVSTPEEVSYSEPSLCSPDEKYYLYYYKDGVVIYNSYAGVSLLHERIELPTQSTTILVDNLKCIKELSQEQLDCLVGFANKLFNQGDFISVAISMDRQRMYDDYGLEIDCDSKCVFHEVNRTMKEGFVMANDEHYEIDLERVCW